MIRFCDKPSEMQLTIFFFQVKTSTQARRVSLAGRYSTERAADSGRLRLDQSTPQQRGDGNPSLRELVLRTTNHLFQQETVQIYMCARKKGTSIIKNT